MKTPRLVTISKGRDDTNTKRYSIRLHTMQHATCNLVNLINFLASCETAAERHWNIRNTECSQIRADGGLGV